jgi:hypothetical protein
MPEGLRVAVPAAGRGRPADQVVWARRGLVVFLERDARRTFGEALRHTLTHNNLTYQLDGLDVSGDPQRRNIRIIFHAQPPYPPTANAPQDFLHVHATPHARSKHRYPDDNALCLWQPLDSPDRRWTSDQGHLILIELIRRHLFLELRWRQTGTWYWRTPHTGFE